MTPYSALRTLAGLSLREASDFHGVRLDTVKSWSAGRNNPPPKVMDDLRALVARQERQADAVVARIKELTEAEPAAADVELTLPVDDAAAQAASWPCVGAWGALVARIIAKTSLPVRLVEPGSTTASRSALRLKSLVYDLD